MPRDLEWNHGTPEEIRAHKRASDTQNAPVYANESPASQQRIYDRLTTVGKPPARVCYLFLAAFLVVRFEALFLAVLLFAVVRFVVLFLAVVFLLPVFV